MSKVLEHKVMGGGFLISESKAETVFCPEDYNEEHQMLRKSVKDFIDKEIEPNKDIFDSKAGTELAPKKLEILGEMGYLGLSVPESYGGAGCDIKTDLAVSEVMSDSFAFSQTLGIQRGLGINTILFYGSEAQQNKYLEGILNGQIKSSYCLTEPGAGSDANSGKTKATLSEDGKYYILNGQKMWITNSGFADVFSVFCKIEDDPHLSCLIVEKKYGVKLGEEERKLGIHGSSTRQVFFEQVKVPVENILGERNKGFKIAMNALNMGRLMIGIAGSAVSKRAFGLGVSYANERVQFGKPISSFGALKEKIAKMASRIYALESSWNRVGGEMDRLMEQLLEEGTPVLRAKQHVAEDFAAECGMIKVLGSEIEQFVVDEALQMHGGLGFSGESDISVLYRNIRGNRIYEGTNEINRQVIPGTILKKAMKGQLPLMQTVMDAMQELASGKLSVVQGDINEKENVLEVVSQVKKAVLLAAGQVMQRYQASIRDHQEVLMRLSDLLSFTYFIESASLRTLKHGNKGGIREKLNLLFMYETLADMKSWTRELLLNCKTETEDMVRLLSLLNFPGIDIIALRRSIADHFIEKNQYEL